jgi:acyl carrier protein
MRPVARLEDNAMLVVTAIIRQGLERAGLGPVRLEGAMAGAELFGSLGLLNSLELVEFIAALSEDTGIEPQDFLQNGDSALRDTFQDVRSLSAFLSLHLYGEQEV